MPVHTPQQRLVLWIIWLSLFSSLFMYRAFLGAEPDEGEPTVDAFLLAMLIVPTVASVFIRWVLLPKASHPGQTLVYAIIGMALAESLVFYGLFLFPAFENLFFGFSVLGVLQFIPVYAHKKGSPEAAFRTDV